MTRKVVRMNDRKVLLSALIVFLVRIEFSHKRASKNVRASCNIFFAKKDDANEVMDIMFLGFFFLTKMSNKPKLLDTPIYKSTWKIFTWFISFFLSTKKITLFARML